MSRTFYTKRTELFAEWRPFIVGQATRFSAHSTLVGDLFKPYTEGKVTVTLSGTGEELTATAEKVDRPGVFRVSLTPTKPGKAKVVVDITSSGSTEHFVIENVPVYATTEEAMAKQGPAEDTGMIRFAKETQWDMDFATVPVESKMVVPATAIVHQDGADYVYVQFNPERYELKPVKTSPAANGSVKINSGVTAKDRIVILGAEKLPRK